MKLEFVVPCETALQKAALDTLETALLKIAGGFSCYDGRGSWKSPNGVVFVERHTRFEIASEPAWTGKLIRAFEKFGLDAGEHTLYMLRDGKPEFLMVREAA